MNWLYAGLLFFIGVGIILWVILTLLGGRRKRLRRNARLEETLSVALCKIESGRISRTDQDWARRTRERLWR